MPDSEAFARVITILNRQFDSGDCAIPLVRIQTFAVSAGTPLKTYLPKYKRPVTNAMRGDTRYLPRQDILTNAVMENVWTQ